MKALLFSFALGMIAVFQGGLNRQFASKSGLHSAVLFNSVVLLVASATYFFLTSRNGETNFKFEWWYVLPGLCGAGLVFGIPWAIPQIGAVRVFLCVVAGQMVMSVLWDQIMEQRQFDLLTVLGILLTMCGLIVANWQRV